MLLLSPARQNARVRVYERILTIASHLRNHNNYMTLNSVLAPLQDIAVGRLELLKEQAYDSLDRSGKLNAVRVSAGNPSAAKRAESLEKIMKPNKRYRTYRMSVQEDLRSEKKGIPLM